MLDKNTFNALDQKFNTAVTPLPEKPQLPAIVETETEKTVADDFDTARDTLRRLMKKGEDVLDDMMNVARQSDHPRAYEVAGQLIKTVGDTAKDLMALQKAKRELQTPEEVKQQSIGTQNNIVFQGSTADLIDMMRQKKKAEVIDVQPSNQSKL